jgi:hypothetical protein
MIAVLGCAMTMTPLAGDLIVRPQGPSQVGLFLVMADQLERPHRSFASVSEALAYARQHAELARVDVWLASSYAVCFTRVVADRSAA